MEHFTNEEILAKVDRVPRTATEIYFSLIGVGRLANGHFPITTSRRKSRKAVGETLEYLSRSGVIARGSDWEDGREHVHFWRR